MSQVEKKQIYNNQTAESFCPLRPLEFNQHNHQPPSQIQELIGLLAQKKSKLRDLRWEGQGLKSKYQQQDRRMTEIKCTMDFHIEKEEVQVTNSQKYKELQKFMQEDIKKLEADVNSLKDELTNYYDEITGTKREKEALVREHGSLEKRLNDLQGKTRKLETQLVQRDNQIVQLQAGFRARHDLFTKEQIEFTDLQSLAASYAKKNILGKKQLHAQGCRNRELQGQVQNLEDRITNLKKEGRETTWQYEKIEVNNKEIEEVNERLKRDLDGVQKHLQSLKKNNEVLNGSIEQYSATAHRVAKLVVLDEPYKFN